MSPVDKVIKLVEESEGETLFQQILDYIEKLEHKIQVYETFAESKGVYSYKEVQIQARHWNE